MKHARPSLHHSSSPSSSEPSEDGSPELRSRYKQRYEQVFTRGHFLFMNSNVPIFFFPLFCPVFANDLSFFCLLPFLSSVFFSEFFFDGLFHRYYFLMICQLFSSCVVFNCVRICVEDSLFILARAFPLSMNWCVLQFDVLFSCFQFPHASAFR